MIYLLSQILEKSADKYPDHDAYRDGTNAISFSEMVSQTNQLARMLATLGVRRGDRVGIFLDRNIYSAIAVHGILKAGAAFVPFDPTAPSARNKFLIQDCQIQHIITQPNQAKRLTAVLESCQTPVQIIGWNPDGLSPGVTWEEVSQMPTDFMPVHRLIERDLAYVMYTSGTTGVPKGIMHTHHSGLRYAQLSAALYEVGPNDRLGNHSPLHFDMSTMGYFTAPLAGATTLIVPAMHTKFPASLTQLIQKEALTIWYSVPLALIQMLQHGALDKRDLSSLRWVLFGGEPFPAKHLNALMHYWPRARFCNVYGPAEVNQCTYYHLPGPPNPEESIPLGLVWEDTEVLIVDKQNREVKPGESGELLVRTPTMMKGYWCQPDLTKRGMYYRERVPGFSEVFYRTGDLVRMDKEGKLLFLGRKDRQIKTRGNRVELDEIEAVLMTIPGVAEAAAYPVDEDPHGLLVYASLKCKANQKLEEVDVQEHVGKHMPWYAVPKKVFFASDIPRTAAGKIDHSKLSKEASKKA